MTPNFFNAIPLAAEVCNFKLTEQEKKELLNLAYENQKGKLLKITTSDRILELPVFSRVKTFIITKANQYKENILSIQNKIILTQSWATINKKGSHHHRHDHSNTFISMVYYVDCDTESGNLVFFQERSSIEKGFNFNFKVIKNNEFNSKEYTFRTCPGLVVLFPGQIKHYSTEHLSDRDRIIIGANFFVEGEIGFKTNMDRINIKTL